VEIVLKYNKQQTMDAQVESYLRKIYYDPAHAASYSGINKFYDQIKKEGKYNVKKSQLKQWIQTQESHTTHRPVIRKHVTQRVVSPTKDYQWDADTAHLRNWGNKNDGGFRYFLLVIDIFSRYIWTRAMKEATSENVIKAMTSIFGEGRIPQNIRTDRGREFLGKKTREFFENNNVHHFTTNNDTKANYAGK
jgi:hypothetical protein